MAIQEKINPATADDVLSNGPFARADDGMSGSEYEVPDWAADATFQQSGADLVLVGKNGEKLTLEGFFEQIPVPSLITLTGQQISEQDIALRIEAGGEVQVAQNAGIQVPGAPGGQDDPLAEPLVDGATGDQVPLSSLESLLTNLSGDGGIDPEMLAVFQAALNEAVLDGVSPEQALAQQQAFVDVLLTNISQGIPPEAALLDAKSVFQVPTSFAGPEEPATDGNILAALASGEGVEAAVADLIQQNQDGAPLTPEQLTAATDAFIEGLQQGLTNGELPADILEGAGQAAAGAIEAIGPAGEQSDGDALLAALASGENTDGSLPEGAGEGSEAFADALVNALETGQPVGDALQQANQQQAELANAIAEQDDPSLADPLLTALATGEGVNDVIGDNADFQDALLEALQNGQSVADAQQQAQSAQDSVDAAEQQSNDPSAVDPLLAALASGDGVDAAVGDSAGFADALNDALQNGGNVAAASQSANQQAALQAQATAESDTGGGDPILAALASGEGADAALGDAANSDAGADTIAAALASGQSPADAVAEAASETAAQSAAVEQTTTDQVATNEPSVVADTTADQTTTDQAATNEPSTAVDTPPDQTATADASTPAETQTGSEPAQTATNDPQSGNQPAVGADNGGGSDTPEGVQTAQTGPADGAGDTQGVGSDGAGAVQDVGSQDTPSSAEPDGGTQVAALDSQQSVPAGQGAVTQQQVNTNPGGSSGPDTQTPTSSNTNSGSLVPNFGASGGLPATGTGTSTGNSGRTGNGSGRSSGNNDNDNGNQGQDTGSDNVVRQRSVDVPATIKDISLTGADGGTEDTTITFDRSDFAGGYQGNDFGVLGRVKILTLPTDGVLNFKGVAATAGQVVTVGELNSGELTFVPSADFAGTIAFNFTASAASRDFVAGSKSISVDVVAVNDAAAVTLGAGTSTTFIPVNGPTVIDGALTVADVDSTDFDGGQLTVQITTNASANDLLDIENQGVGAGQIGFADPTIKFEGNSIGTAAGGTTSLVITLTGTDATPAAVQALMRAITYDYQGTPNDSLDPVVNFTLTDGDGGTSAVLSRTVNISTDSPEVATAGGQTGFLPGDGGVAIDPSLTITDPTLPQPDYFGGTLVATITSNGEATDRLSIENQGTDAGPVGLSGSNVTYAGLTVATVSGGTGTTPLTLTFTAGASTHAIVQAVGRAISFNSTTNDPTTASRVISFKLTDAASNVGTVVSRTVTIDQTSESFSSSTPNQQSLTFDGGDFLSLGNSTTLVNGGAATWEGWINTSQTTGTQTILGMGEVATANVVTNGSATLTSGATINQTGEYKVSTTGTTDQSPYFSATFDAKIGDGSGAGEGFSFNYGVDNNPFDTGVATGLAITFDSDASGNDVMVVEVDGVVKTTVTQPANFFRTDTDQIIDLGGTNDALVMGAGSSDELLISDNLTVEAWLNPDELSSTGGDTFISIGGKGDIETSAENILFRAQIEADGSIQVLHESNSGDNRTVSWSDAGITPGQWQHVAITRDVSGSAGGDYTLYVNGVSKGTISYNTAAAIDDPTGGADGILMIGGQQTSTGGVNFDYNGQMDDVRVWNVERTASQISSNYESELSGSHTGLVANYTFDGTVGTDSAGSASNGSVVGTVTQIYGEPTAKDNNATTKSVSVTYDANGLDVSYGGTSLVSNLDLGNAYNPQANHDFVIGARNTTGADQHVISNVTIDAAQISSANALVVENGNLAFKTTLATSTAATSTTTTDTGVTVADGEWHKVSMTHDGDNTLKMYVDGVLVKTQTGVTKEMFTGDAFIGKSSSGSGDFFNGTIGEVSVWNAVLTDEQINTGLDPNISNPGTTTNLVGYWNMSDDLAGGVVTDSSANSNDATLGATTGASTDDPTSATSSQAILSSSDWTIVEGGGASGGDSVLIRDNEAVISNRELLRSTEQFDPTTSNPVHLTGTFSFKGPSDFFHIATRADTSTLTTGGLPATGINFKVDMNGNFLTVSSYSSATETALTINGDASITLTQNAQYEFEVFDDGTDLRFIVSEVGNSANAADITASSSLAPTTNYVVVTNREYTTESHAVSVDNLRLDHGFLTEEGTAFNGTLNAPSVTGALTYSVVSVGDASHGTFTITNTATGAFTYTPTAGFHGEETIRYQVVNGSGATDTTTLRIRVEPDLNVQVQGDALSFDGVSEYVQVADSAELRLTNTATIEAWVKLSAKTVTGTASVDEQLIVGKTGGATDFMMVVDANGFVSVQYPGTDVTGTVKITDGEWHHVSYVLDATSQVQSIYIDGQLDVSTSTTAGFAGTSTTLFMGGYGNARQAVGEIDEVRIWNTARSADDINLNYDQHISTSQSGLVANYSFNNVVDSTVEDLSGNNNTISLGSTTQGDASEPTAVSQFGKVLSLDGTNDIVVVPDDTSLNFGGSGSFTLEGWVNSSSTASDQRIFFKGDGGSGQSYSLMLKDGKAHVRFDDGTNSWQAESTAIVNDGTWHHIAGVFDNAGNTLAIYVDGAVVATTTVTTNPVQATQPLDIGGISTGSVADSQYFNGQLDDLRVWNTARTPDQILDNYTNTLSGTQNGTLVAHYTFDDGTANDVAGSNNGTLTNGAATIDKDGPDVYGAEIIAAEGNDVSGQMVYDDVLAGDVSYHVLDGATPAAVQQSFTTTNGGTVTIDAQTGDWTYTPSVSYNGTDTFTLRAAGATSGEDDEVITVTVKKDAENSVDVHGNFAQLDGVDAHSTMVTANTLTLTSHSMEVWINTTATNDPDQGYVAMDDSGKAVAQILSQANGGWRVELNPNTDVANNFKRYESNITVNDGAWHHLAYTYDASTDTLRLYVDGVEDTNVNLALNTSFGNNAFTITDEIYLGMNRDEAGVVDARIDEVRIWSDARTSAEIQEHYNDQIASPSSDTSLAAYYRFDDTSEPTKVQNLSSAGDTLDMTIGAGASIINPTSRAMRLDGTGDQVDLGSPTAFNFGSGDFTTEIWFQTAVTNNTRMDLIQLGNTATGNQGAFLFIENGNLRFDTFASADVATTASVNDGQWHHAAMTRSGTTVRLYLDGELAATGELTFTVPTGTSNIGNIYTGDIGDVRIWNTARTDAQIADNFNQELDGGQPGLVAHYQFDEASGATTLIDSVGDNNGTVNGNPTWVDVGPGVHGNTLTILENQNANGTVTPNDASGTITYSVGSAASNGTVTVDANGNWKYVPNENFHGTDTFALNTSGSVRGSDSETITITVKDVAHKSVNVSDGALRLDGTGDHVDIGTVSGISGAYSVETWINLTAYSTTGQGWGRILDLGNGEASDNILFALDGATGKVVLGNYVGGTATSITTANAIPLGEWLHVAAVNNGDGTSAVYFNGVAQTITGNTTDLTAGANVARASSFIGESNWAADDELHAMIDEVRIWNDARTAEEIRDNYSQQIEGTVPTELIGYYRFDDQNEVTKVQNLGSSGDTNDGTLTGDASIINTLGSAARFDGSTGYVSAGRGTGDNLAITGDLTMETWAKFDDLAPNALIYFTEAGSANTNNVLYGLQMLANGKLRYYHESGNGVVTDSIDFAAITLTANEWVHIALVRDVDTNSLKLYLDGQWVETQTYANDPDGGATAELYVGFKNNGTDYYMDGEMADVRIWNTARTDQEILDNYNTKLTGDQGGNLVLNYKLDDAAGSNVTDSAGSNNGTIVGDVDFIQTGPEIYGAKLTLQENESASGYMTANDIVHSVLDIGKPGENDVATGVKVTNFSDFPTSALTVEMWVNPDAIPGTLVSYGVSGSPNELFVHMNDANTLRFFLNNDSQVSMSGFNFTVGEWSHLSFSWQTGSVDNLSAYQNGKLIGQITVTDTELEAGGSFYLGADQDSLDGGFANTDSFDGKMAEVRVWNDVRSATELADNFDKELAGSENNLVAYWQLNEGTGTTAVDKAYDSADINDVNHAGTVLTSTTGYTSDAPVLPLTNDGTQFSVTGAGTADSDGWVTATTAEGGTVRVDTVSGEYIYTPVANYYGTDSFVLTSAGDGNTSITDSETISVTINREDQTSVNVHGSAAQFDGVDDYVSVADANSLDITGDLTLEAWINPQGVGADTTNGGVIFGKEDAYLLGRFPDGSISFALNGANGAWQWIDTGYDAPLNTWVHIALVFDASASTVYTYANGNLVATNTDAAIPSDITSNATSLRIGGRENFGGQPFHGQIDDVRVWDDLRTAAEIRDNYDQILSGSETNLQAYYQFEDSNAATVVTDHTANQNHGTLTGGASIVDIAATSGPALTGNAFVMDNGAAFNGIMNSDDVAGSTIAFSKTADPANGTLTIDANTGAWTYTPNAGYVGNDSFTVQAQGTRTGGTTLTDSEVITVRVTSDDTVNVSNAAMQFDGNDYVDLGAPATFASATADFTWEAWVNTSSTAARQQILVLGSTAVDRGGWFFIDTDGKVHFDVSGRTGPASETVVADGLWHHVAITKTGNNYQLYVDGEVDGAVDVEAAPNFTSGVGVIGANDTKDNFFFNGQIDEVRVWSDARTADEIYDNHNQQIEGTLPSELKAYWQFSNTVGSTTVEDLTSNNFDGTITGATYVPYLGGALNFAGTSYINAGNGAANELIITGDLTLETWINLDSNAGTQSVLDFANTGNADNTSNALYQWQITDTGDVSYTHEMTAGNSYTTTFDTNLAVDQWYHLSLVRETSTNLIKLFVNGSLFGSAAYVSEPTDGSNATLIIGGSAAGSSLGDHKINAQMSDLRIWKTARTDAEVADNFDQHLTGNQGSNLVLNYHFDETSGTTVADSSGLAGGATITGTSTWVDTAPDVYGEAITILENENAVGRFEADATAFTVSSNASNGSVTIDAAGNWAYTPTANYFGTDTFTLSATGVDSETITVNITSQAENSVNVAAGAAQFDGGLVDRIQTSVTSGTITTNATFEMNVQFNDLTGQQHFLLYRGDTNSQDIVLYKTASNTLAFWVHGTNIDSGVTATADTWYHVAATYNGTTAQIYIDGDLKATGASSTVDLSGNPQTLSLGGNPLADASINELFEFKGMMDEVRVWSDIRTAQEIRDNYQGQITATGNNLEVYYRFDDDGTDTVTDHSGNSRDGTSSGGNVLALDGTGDYVQVAHDTALDVANWTVEGWFQTTSHTGSNDADIGRIVSKAQATGGNHFSLYIKEGKIYTNTNATSGASINSSGIYNDGQWHHAAGVYDGTTLKLYVDGILIETSTVGSTPDVNDVKTLNIGAYDDGAGATQFFNGNLDEVRVWSDARTQVEIIESMHQTVDAGSSNLVAQYTFDDDVTSAGTVDNNQGTASLDGTLNGNAAITSSNSSPVISGPEIINLPGKALDLNGTSQYVSVPDLGTSFQDITVETWLNLDALPANNDYAMLIGNSTFDATDNYLQFENNSSVMRLLWHSKAGNVSKYHYFSHDFAQDLNEWMHVSVVRDTSANNLMLYIDGDLVETLGYLQSEETTVNWDDAVIGSYQGTSQFMDGSLSDFRIWKTARNGDEIKATYNQTLTGSQNGDLRVNYVMDELTGATLADEAGSSQNGTVVGSPTLVDVAPTVLDTQMTITEGETATGTMTANDVVGATPTYSITSNPAQGSVSIDSSSGQWTYTPPENYAGTVTFNVRATGTVTDTETITVTVAADAESAVHGGALQFDGVNDHVMIDTSSSLQFGTGDFSVEGWVKLDQVGVNQTIIDARTGANQQGYFIGVSASNALQFQLSDGVDGTMVSLFGGTTLSADTWYHFAATVDRSGNVTLHTTQENGATNATTASATGDAATIGSANIYLGGETPAVTTVFTGLKGQLDEIRFWDDLRSTAEIADNYNEQIDPSTNNLVANYQFNDGSGTVVRDATSNNNDGEINVGSTGPNGHVLQLDGNADWVDINNTSATQNLATGTGAFTYEAWIKTSKAGYQTVMSVGNTTSDQESLFFLQTAGELSYHLRGSSPTITSTQKVNDGNWHHVAFVYDGSDTGTLYIDGGVDGTGTGLTNTNITGSGSVLTAAKARIGTQSTNDQEYFEGQMDTVRFWGSARTAEEIRDGMTQTYDYDTTDLLGQYTFDDVSSPTVRDDTSTQANGTLTNDATIADSGSGEAQFINHLGNALRFASGDSVTFTASAIPTGTAQRTIMLWAKTDGDGNYNFLNYGSGVDDEIHFGLNRGPAKGVRLDINGSVVVFEPASPTADGQWHHYTLVLPDAASLSDTTLNLNDIKVYQDGVLLTAMINAVSPTTAITTGITTNMTLGGNFVGDMAEVSLWDTALTTAQINDYMSKSLDGDEAGLVGYYKLDEEPGTATASDSSSNNNAGTLVNAVFVDNAPPIEGSSIEIAENASASGQMTDVDVTGIPTYTLIGSPMMGNVDLDAASGQWTYTPNADTQGADSFTIRASGATSGIDDETVSIDIGKDPALSTDYSLSFNDNDDFVAFSNVDNMATSALTVEFWMKTTGTSESMFSYAVADSFNEVLIYTSGTSLSFAANGVISATKTNAGVTDGLWHHVAASYDGTTTKLYVDGGLQATDAANGSGSITSGGTIVLGQDQDSVGGGFETASAFTGEMNEVRVWNTVRTDTEISANFDRQANGDETGLIAYWDFDEGSGFVVADQTGNANDGVLSGGTTYKNLTTVTMGNGESYKGMILGEDPDGDNLAYSITSGSSLSGFSLNGNTYSYDSHATDDGTNEVSIDITDDNGDVTTETLNFVVS